MNKKWYEKPRNIIIIIFISVCIVPLYINGAYKSESAICTTIWDGENFLLYYGSALAFIGTVALGALAFWQNLEFRKKSNIEKKLDRTNSLKPFFLIVPKISPKEHGSHCNSYKYNSCVDGIFKLQITNRGQFDIFNVVISHELFIHDWISKDDKTFNGHFEDCTGEKENNSILFEESFNDNIDGLPQYITINYDDYDGNSFFQIYKKMSYEQTVFYTLDTYEEC